MDLLKFGVQKGEEKDVFGVTVDDSIESAIKGAPQETPEGAPKDARCDVHKGA